MDLSTPLLGSDPSIVLAPSPLHQQGQGGHHPQHLVRYRHSCEHCRKRKIKCSGTRPICNHCLRRGIPCIYKPLARARRTPTISGSPAQHLAISGSFDHMFSGLAPPSPFAAGSNGAQPIPIPMSMPPDGQLADTAGTAFSQLSPYSIYQHPDPRFSSAPHSAAMSFAQNMFGSQSPAGSAGNVSGQSNKQMRPANAIPPHLLETANMNSAMSPINTPQTPFLLTGFPADLTGLSGSFNSAQSDVSEIMSPMGNSSNNATQMMTQKSDETVDMHTLYDIQIPPQQAAGHAAASLGSLSTQSPGISLGECTGSSFLNEDGTLSVFPSTSQPAQSAFIGGDSKKYGHKRTLTQDSSDSLSNMPLLERTSMEVAAAPFEKRYDAGNKMGSSEFDQFLFSLSQHQESIDSFSSALSPEMMSQQQQQQQQQKQQQQQQQQQQLNQRFVSANNGSVMRTDTGPSGNGGSVNASNGSANNVNGIGGIAPELTVYSEQRLGGSDSSRSQRSVPSQQSQQMF